MKNKLVKKMAVGALTTAVVASQIATTIPYNVFAAETTSKTQATQATATQYYTTIPRLGDRKISVVHPDSKTISGYVHPGEMVTVHSNDGVIMGTPKFSVSTVADSVTGAFSVAIPQVPENAIVQIDLGTDHSLGAIVRSVTASDGVYHFGGTTVNPLTTDSTTVSGLIPPYSGAMITLADGTTLEAYSGADENYSATIPKQPEGAVIYVYKDYNPVDNDEFPAGGQSNNAQTTVTAAPAPDTTSPVITASNLSLQEGTSFNPKAGVTASDDTDGDITNKIVVTSNNVDTSKAGTYNVTYSVTDAAGNVATKTITVTVYRQLTIDTVKSTDTQVVMHGKAGSQGRLFNDETGVKLGTRFTFDATGTYVLKLGSPLASGTKLKVWYTYNQTATYRTTVVDATKPVITADNQSLTVGDSFDPKAGVTASDDLDGDITSKIAITSNNVDTKKAGTYSVTYSVSDAAGNMATKTITVTVNKAPDTTKPVITASNLSLQEGTNFDPKAGVTASDDTDGDITNKITVTSNNVDTSKAGTYSVTYSVSDAAGNVATKTITVTVFTKLSIDTVKSTDTQVVMHGKAGSQGRLFNDETGVKLGARFTFDATGTYVLKLGSPLASGTKLKVWYTYNQTATYRTTVVDATKPVITASNQTLTVGDNFNPKAGVTASDDLDGDITSKIAVTSNNVDTSKVGTYSVSYSVTDAAGNVATKTITVTVKEAPDTTKPVITASNKTLTVGDSFDPKAGVTASDNKDGNITSKITVTSNNVDTSKAGTYSVTYSVSDAAGNIGTKTITVTVKEAPTSGTITANDFTIGKDGYIKGAITGDVASIKMIINGKAYSPRNVQSPSNYQYYVAGKITSVNDAVAIVAYDKNGKELDRANVNVKNNQAEVGTITAKTFTIGQDGYVQGTYTGKAAKVGLLVNGKELNNISISGGSYRYYASHYITSVNDDVYAVLYDASGLEMARVKVAVQKAADNTSGTITANDFAIGDGDNYVRGTFTGDVAKVSMIVNGKEGTRISVSGGNYQYYAGSKISSVNDAVTVVAYDVNGKELDRKTVNVKKAEVPTAGTITAQDYLLGGNDKYIYGTTTGDAVVVKMMVNGKLIPAQRAVDADGSYKYYAGSNVTSINDVVTMITYDAKGKELDRTNVKLTQTAGTLAIDPYTLGDSYLTGKATGDVAKVQLLVNGVAKSTAFVKDGAFSYYAKSTITSKTGNYVLVGLDGAGRELTRQTVTVK